MPSSDDMIRHPLSPASHGAHRTQTVSVVEKAKDQPTADLLTQRLEVHEKTVDAAQFARGVSVTAGGADHCFPVQLPALGCVNP